MDKAEFAKEINVVMEERRLRTDDQAISKVFEALNATAFVAHPYRNPIVGWMDDLKNMTAADALAWYERWYAPNNATMVVTGDVDAKQVFVLAEKYFGKKAYVGVAGFHRDLETFIYSETIQKDFANLARGTTGVYPLIDYTAPKNGKGGKIQGVELTANAPLDLLSPALSGFGVYVSHSNTSSKVSIPNTAGGSATTMAMPGLSRSVTNMNVYYEKSGFSARLGERSRSDFVGQITSNEYNRELIYIKAEKIYDAQVGYEFKEGTYRGLGIFAVANNLSNAAYETYKVNSDGTREARGKLQYGKSFGLNVNYKF